MKTDFSSGSRRASHERLEQVVGCKWSVSILEAIRRGTRAPGSLERTIPGISTKMLSEQLKKLAEYGLLSKRSFSETPARTEYHLTALGRRLADIIDQLHDLDEELDGPARGHRRPAYFVPSGHP